MTRKLFPFIFPVFLCLLGYLIYSHWYAPDRPVAYYPSAENQIPEHLESLELVDINGDKTTIHMKDAPYTLFAFVLHVPEIDSLDEYYQFLADRREAYDNVRIVFLWSVSSEDNTIDYIREVAQNDTLDRNILTNRVRVNYQESNNLDIVRIPSFIAYDSEGNLALKSTSPRLEELGIMIRSLR